MLNKITLYIAITAVVFLGIGYGTGHYVASSKAENDIAAIRAILEAKEAEEAAAQEDLKRIVEEQKEIYRRRMKSIGM